MSPHKQPESLYNLAFKVHTFLLYNTCLRIEDLHETIDSPKCVEAVEDLQSKLLSTVPGCMWNDMCERLILFVHNQETQWISKQTVLEISYTLFAHEKLSHVKLVCSYGHCWGLSVQPSNIRRYVQFWERILMKIDKATTIRFPFAAVTDKYQPSLVRWMFELISRYCKDLERICVGWKGVHINEAVTALLECEKLRRIEGSCERGCKINCNCWESTRNTTRGYLNRVMYKRILDSLPELEYFEDPHLVSCFADFEDGRSLKLTELIVDRSESTPANVTLALRICSNLKRLDIEPKSVQECVTILDLLADSPINLTSLRVRVTSFNAVSYSRASGSCQRYFSAKGIHLLDLTFDNCHGAIDFKTVKILGQHCLNLKFLQIKQYSHVAERFDRPSASDMSINHQSPVFKKLTSLTLKGYNQDSGHRLVKWCVLHATNLETLTLDVDPDEMNLEDFRDMFAPERLPEVVIVSLMLGSMSKEMVQCLYDNCPKMRKLFIGRLTFAEVTGNFKSLKQHIASHNIDLAIYHC